MPGMEQRYLSRKPVRFPIIFSGDLLDGEGEVIDLSTSGCGVFTEEDVKSRSYVHALLYLPNEEKPMKVELAAVRWSAGEAFGLEFIRITTEQKRRLREYLHMMDSRPTH